MPTLDTTAALKEVIQCMHDVLSFGDMDAAYCGAARFIELNATLTCAGLTDSTTPMPWRRFGEYQPEETTAYAITTNTTAAWIRHMPAKWRPYGMYRP